jgi:HEAT repeat protein
VKPPHASIGTSSDADVVLCDGISLTASAVVLADKAEELIRRLSNSPKAVIAFLFGKGTPSEFESLLALGDAAIPAIRNALEHSDDSDLRTLLICVLEAIGTDVAKETLLDFIQDADEFVSSTALQALTNLKCWTDTDVRMLVAMFGDGRRDSIGESLVIALASMGSGASMAYLSQWLQSPDAWTRKMTAEALAMPGETNEAFFWMLLDALAREDDLETKCAIVEALGVCGGDMAIPLIAEVLEGDAEPTMAFVCTLALAKMGSYNAWSALKDLALNFTDIVVRAEAISNLAYCACDPKATRLLLENMFDSLCGGSSSPHPDALVVLLSAMARVGDSWTAARALRAYHASTSEQVRSAAIAVMALGGGNDYLPQIENAIFRDPDASVRKQACDYMLVLGHEERLVADVKSILGSETDPKIRGAMASALGTVGYFVGRAAVEDLLTTLMQEDQNTEVKAAAQDALSYADRYRAENLTLLKEALIKEKK